MRRTAFLQCMWGFLFILLSFRFNGFDILPDFVGYILFFIGLSTLAAENASFSTARTLSIPLLILSVFEEYQAPNHTPGFHVDGPLGASVISILMMVVGWIVLLVFVYQLCEGTRKLSESSGHHTLAALSKTRWNNYIAYQIFVIAVTVLAVPLVFLGPLLIALIIGGFVWGLILAIIMMQWMSQCANEL